MRPQPPPEPFALPLGAQPDLDSKLVAALERIGQALRLQLRDEAKRHGLSPTQLQLLIRLSHAPAQSHRVVPLAQELDVTQPTISDAMGALRSKGLVARRRSAADARAWTLELTERGQALAAGVSEWHDRTRTQLATLPAADKEQTLRVLLETISRLQQTGVITVARLCLTCRFYRPDAHPAETRRDHCALLDLPLGPSDLRVDCPEHQLAA